MLLVFVSDGMNWNGARKSFATAEVANEFEKMVKLQTAENQIVIDFGVCALQPYAWDLHRF